jgi:small nuclear ribonucleoprotein F
LRRALLLRALQLGEAEEFIDGDFAGKLGEILIRCNNVMYIRAAPEEGAGAAEMDD